MRLGFANVTVLLLAGTVIAADPPAYVDPELTTKDRDHWAFRKPMRPAMPAGAANPIDAFIRAQLTEKKLTPSPEADRRTLIRRVTYDLIGLPPTPAEIDAFLADQSPNAYEKVVDRLLASPHFGERQAQHWLDLVRFAESNGYELDADRPHAWRYRDYVIKSFNTDKPFDVFAKEQIAGDELARGKPVHQVADLLIATGFHRAGPVHVVSGNLDAAVVRQEVLTEMVVGVGSAFLGLTMGCARCHDHKFDPLSQGDYYRLEAFFAGARFKDVELSSAAEQKKVAEQIAAVKKETDPIRKAIAEIEAPYREKLKAEKTATLDEQTREALKTPTVKRTAEQKKLVKAAEGVLSVRWDEILAILPADVKDKRAKLRQRLFEIEAKLPRPAAEAWSVANDDETPATYVLKRGDVKRKSLKVEPQTPRVVSDARNPVKTRTDLAEWLTQADHTLTARVIVNRLWHQHFGRGIVNTPNDFGSRGGRPTHPELLDWLACELVKPSDGGIPWSLKRIHRMLVSSATYRQVSDRLPSPGEMATDPDNSLLWRMNRRRLDAEAIRDGILAAAGTLNRKAGGPSVRVPLEPEVYDLIFSEDEPDHLWRVTEDPAEHDRRSIYLYAKRNVRYPMLEAFDQPDAINSCSVRGVSTFAPQALIMMNGPFARQQAERMAQSVLAESDDNPVRAIMIAYRRSLGREPSETEQRIAREFLSQHEREIRKEKPALTNADRNRMTFADFCLALVNTSEFAYIP
jgi:hypothetical protein